MHAVRKNDVNSRQLISRKIAQCLITVTNPGSHPTREKVLILPYLEQALTRDLVVTKACLDVFDHLPGIAHTVCQCSSKSGKCSFAEWDG